MIREEKNLRMQGGSLRKYGRSPSGESTRDRRDALKGGTKDEVGNKREEMPVTPRFGSQHTDGELLCILLTTLL